MDLNDLRSGVTLVSLLLFVALMVWCWLPRRAAEFDDAAQLPLRGDGETR